jgi:hypothetical protein
LENAGSLSVAGDALGFTTDGTGSIVNDVGATLTYDSSISSSLNVPFTNNGTVIVGGGGSLMMGTFTSISTSTLNVEVSATPGNLSSVGTARVDGILAIATQSGYLPAVGTQFTILSASSSAGIFSAVTGAQMAGEHWAVSYTATSVVLTAVSG